MDNTPQSLIQAVRHFSDIDRCNEYMVRIRWSDGNIECSQCGAYGDRIGRIETRKMLCCKDCRKQFSYKVGTIFEDSPLGLDKWFVAVWCLINCKNGISSYELSRALGVTQKSAWFMLHRIRTALEQGTLEKKMTGTVEADETAIGGLAKNMHKHKRKEKVQGRGVSGKQIVHGVLERGGKVIAAHVKDNKRSTVSRRVRQHVENGAIVCTDSLSSYDDLVDEYTHETVDHSVEYVRGNCHTNTMENFWSLLKRCLKGTYVSVLPWHLAKYVDEQVYRYNERKKTDGQRFKEAMGQVIGKRLTYDELVQTV